MSPSLTELLTYDHVQTLNVEKSQFIIKNITLQLGKRLLKINSLPVSLNELLKGPPPKRGLLLAVEALKQKSYRSGA